MSLQARITAFAQAVAQDVVTLFGLLPKRKQMASDFVLAVNGSSTSRTQVASLTVPVKAGVTYRLDYLLAVASSDGYSAPRFDLVFPDGDMNLQVNRQRRQRNNNAQNEGYITQSGVEYYDTRTNQTNVMLPCMMRGSYACRADGEIQFFMGTYGLFGNITLGKQSMVVFQKVLQV